MNLKEFLKSFSIYGFLPVFTKFASFLLVPIYVRVFSKYEFGIVELITSTIHFLIFAMNLEFYGAVGRFFFERETKEAKQKLISTGLWITVLASVFVSCIVLVFQNQLTNIIFKGSDYGYEFRLGIVWAILMAISTYLSVLPRYEKKAKLYVTYNVISLLVKLFSTILYVVVFHLGVAGVILGNITGSFVSVVLYTMASFKYIRPVFNKADMFEICRFSLPIVPGLLLVGVYQPLMRTLMSRVYSIEELGLFSFALRMVTIMALVETAIKLSWRPLLFENIRKSTFGTEYHKISAFVGRVLLVAGCVLTALSPELVRIIGTKSYMPSAQIIGFMVIGNILINLNTLRGFGFEVAKKTYMITVVSFISSAVGLLTLLFISRMFGFIGIGLAFALPGLVSYLIQYHYTRKVIKSTHKYTSELMLWGALVLMAGAVILDVQLGFRLVALAVIVALATPAAYIKKMRTIIKHV